MLHKRSYTVALLICLLPLFLPSPSYAWTGACVAVTDGDTIKVMHEGKTEKIRLYGIDCPEKKQPFGTKAKQFTGGLVFGKIVDVDALEKDRYGRTIAWVYISDKCLNGELLKAGLAWHYKRYSKETSLAEMEDTARLQKIGLWTDPHPVPPWSWRRERRPK